MSRLILSIFLGGAFLIVLGSGCASTQSVQSSSVISLHGHPLSLELALTSQQQQLGLGGRTSLAMDQGMLFPFATTGTYPFWMEGMKIPIDLIWIQDQKIVGIETNLPAPRTGERPVTVIPPVPINRVLELPAGGAKAYGLEKGMLLSELP